MSRSAFSPLRAGATAPENLSLLHQRLLLAEAEAEALIEDMGVLGVSRDQILGSEGRVDSTKPPVSPLKKCWVLGDDGMLWHKCDSLVSRVSRMESLLQTLKLTVFRLGTEKELDPCNTAHLKQQLAALRRDSELEQQASRREVMKLQDQLQQAYQERDEALAEMQRLEDTVETAAAAKINVALAAKELKIFKSEMCQKLLEMKEQMRQESALSVEATKSHSELLQRVEEMERVMEVERRQALLLQSDCQALRVEVQTGRQQLEEEKARVRQLEGHCQQLKEQTAMKDSLVSELKTELKGVGVALQRQRTGNSNLLSEGKELRTAADRDQAEQSCVIRQLQEQNLLLEAARCSIHSELQGALTCKVSLQLELEQLKGEHAKLLRSSSTTQETADTQNYLLERTIERLRGKLARAKKQEAAMSKDLECSKNELCLVVTKLEDEKRCLETKLSEAKLQVGSLSSALQSQQDENRKLMGKVTALEKQQMPTNLTDENKPAYGKGKLKISDLEGVCDPVGSVVSETLKNILASQNSVQLSGQTLQQELRGQGQDLATLKKDRLQAQGEMRKHQAEVEKLQQILTSARSKHNRALESVQKALDTANMDNKRLSRSVERVVLTNTRLHRKMKQARDQYQATIALRDEELCNAVKKISALSEELCALKEQTKGDYESSRKTLHREISELKMTVEDSLTRSGDLSKVNQELRQRVSELEWQVFEQIACIREQRKQLKQQQKSRDLQDNRQNTERFEESTRNLLDSRNLQEAKMDSQQILQEAECERWTSTIQRWEAKRQLAHSTGGSKPVRTQLITQ